MKHHSIIVCLFRLLTLFLFIEGNAQGIRDSIFHINTIEIRANNNFKKENAGMKESHIDTLVLQEKLNLNLSELLAQNSTIYIKSYGRGALATASFRGTAPTHTKVSWNGMPINSPMLGMVDFSTIPVYILDDVNIQYGAASISQNGGALGGNINLGNHVNWNNTFSGRLLSGIGSFSTYDAMGQVNVGNKKVQSKTRLYHNQSENDYTFPNKNIIGFPRQKNKLAHYGKTGLLHEIYYRPFKLWTTSAKVWYQDAQRSIPTVMSYEGSDTIQRRNNQDNKTLKITGDLAYYGHAHTLKIRSGYDYQALNYVMSIVGQNETQTPVYSESKMFSNYNHIEDEYKPIEAFTIKASADINYFDIATLDSVNHTGYNIHRVETSVFSGFYYQVIAALNLSAELRKDWIPQTNTPLIYTLGASIKPFNDLNLVWNHSFCRNFHNPSLNDLYWVPGGNPELLPEEGYTYESNLHTLLSQKHHQFEGQITAYYSDINNWILWLPSLKGPWEAINLKRVISYGLECNLKHHYQAGHITVNTQANYAFTSTSNEGSPIGTIDMSLGQQLPFIPKHTFNALLNVKYKNTFATLQHQYYGVRYLLSSNLSTLDDDSHANTQVPFYRLYAVPLHHLSIGQYIYFNQRNKSLKAELKIYNLLNESYRNILNRFMPQRYGELMITYHF